MSQEPCDHSTNAGIRMPSMSGRANPDGCPFVWCRKCGAIWLPRQPTFDRAFERHEKQEISAPVDGVTIQGYWILPGIGGIIRLPS